MPSDDDHMQGPSPIDKFIERLGHWVRWLAVAMVLLQFFVVIARYLFDAGSVMAQEGILILFGTMFMLALSDALAADRHVRVDIFYRSMPPQQKRMIDAAGILVFLLPFCIFILWTSVDYVWRSWATFEGSRDVAGLPGLFLFKTIIPVALILVIAQSLAILWRCLTYKEKRDD